ncbi:hypothetical protein ACLOJK_028118 [Asimina triloba]
MHQGITVRHVFIGSEEEDIDNAMVDEWSERHRYSSGQGGSTVGLSSKSMREPAVMATTS